MMRAFLYHWESGIAGKACCLFSCVFIITVLHPNDRIKCAGEKSETESIETINARYLIACDGAHSWVRSELGVLFEGRSEDSTWGVLDIVPITNFRASNPLLFL